VSRIQDEVNAMSLEELRAELLKVQLAARSGNSASKSKVTPGWVEKLRPEERQRLNQRQLPPWTLKYVDKAWGVQELPQLRCQHKSLRRDRTVKAEVVKREIKLQCLCQKCGARIEKWVKL
jgi:hypothetical protein